MIALLAGAWAHPTACEATDSDGHPTGPLAVGIHAGDLGRARRACPRSEVSLGGGGAVTVDTADFYGRIQILGIVEGSARIGKRGEIHAGIEGLRSESVIAPIPVGSSGLGHAWVGGSFLVDQTKEHAFAVTSRVILPTAGIYGNQRPLAGDIGLVVHKERGRTDFHGGAMLSGSVGLGRAPSNRGSLSGLFGVGWRAGKALSLVLDIPASLAWDSPLDYIGLAPGIRLGAGLWSLELGVMAPVVGGDRTLLAGELKTAFRFD